uniref:Doublecortin domain-containing protein n=1 Tax=Enterobius vermicularis TaxID=51028 RepID=A0A0N4V794_ENTVE
LPSTSGIRRTNQISKTLSPIVSKRILIYRNGDAFHKGLKVAVNTKHVHSVQSLLDVVNEKIGLPNGAKKLYTLSGQLVKTMDGIEDGKVLFSMITFDYLFFFSVLTYRNFTLQKSYCLILVQSYTKKKQFFSKKTYCRFFQRYLLSSPRKLQILEFDFTLLKSWARYSKTENKRKLLKIHNLAKKFYQSKTFFSA